MVGVSTHRAIAVAVTDTLTLSDEVVPNQTIDNYRCSARAETLAWNSSKISSSIF